MALARKIGLLSLNSRIMKENAPSVSMLKKITDEVSDEGNTLLFTVNLK